MRKSTIPQMNTTPLLAAAGAGILILVSTGSINAQTKIANGSITTKKLANSSVSNTKLRTASVTEAKLADGSVTTPKLADGSVTLAKLTSNIGLFLANGPDVYWNGNVGVGTSSPNTRLDVNGTVSATGLRSPGAGINTGTFAFIHRASVSSISGHITTIDNALCNGDAGAIVIVTHNWTADTSVSKYFTNPVGVYYTGNRWRIFTENITALESGDAFNVMVIKP